MIPMADYQRQNCKTSTYARTGQARKDIETMTGQPEQDRKVTARQPEESGHGSSARTE
jgi:hypothetical protein